MPLSRSPLGSQSWRELERRAEAAYAAMYEAPPRSVKDCWDDARLFFGKAIEAAGRAGAPGEVARLKRRLSEVAAVYARQFRHVGW
ncbi:MAG: hypothetical protein ACLPSW_21155 [Roseiarcus sp.]